MTININESFITEKALDYAKLSDLAYGLWKYTGQGWVLDKDAYEEDKKLKEYYEHDKIWRELKAPEKGYTIVDHTPNDPLTGFSATIFQKGGKDILAIRGSEDYYDYLADAAVLDDKVLPYAQFQSLIDYVAGSGLTDFDVTGHSLGASWLR